MKPYRRFSTLPQLTVALLVFAAAALLLESGGLYNWAQRLELGPERRVAVPVTTALHHGLARFGLEKERTRALVALARVGWSDDPVALAEAHGGSAATPAATLSTSPAVTTATSPVAGSVNIPVAPLKPLADAPPLLTALPEIDEVGVGETRTIALAGDSMMAVGLATTISHQAPAYKDLVFVKAFKSGTGLARPEVFDWQREYPAMLKDAQPDFVVVAIGANDGQGFVEDGVTYPFGTEDWQQVYQRRVAAYLQMLEATGATVVWIGLPPMKSDVYDARIAMVNRIAATVVNASPHAIWFSTAGIVGDAAGKFRDFGDVDGHTVRLRQSDGIHLSDEGASLVVRKLLPWLGKQEAPPPAVVPAAAPPAPSFLR